MHTPGILRIAIRNIPQKSGAGFRTRSSGGNISKASVAEFWPSGLNFGALSRFQPHPQFGRLFPVADQAKSADVGEVALAAAFDDGNDVVGIPQRFSIDPSETPARKQLLPVGSP